MEMHMEMHMEISSDELYWTLLRTAIKNDGWSIFNILTTNFAALFWISFSGYLCR